MSRLFPQDFVWGTATASFQVEGAAAEGGRTPSIWDTLCLREGAVIDKSDGSMACDQYHRYPEDIEIMKQLGVRAYRFSISWSRVIPDINGEVNPEGIAYYEGLIDALHVAGIKAFVTLYHWDLPQYLEDRGGWANRETAYKFAEYVAAVARAFGKKVDSWITLNEPWCAAYLGYGNGVHAPGVVDYHKALRAVHHLNLAHGLAVTTLREILGYDIDVSVTLNLAANVAETDSAEDKAAKRRADLMSNEVWLGPMLEGKYDPEIFEATKHITNWDYVLPGDMEIIHQPLQNLGINYYSSTHVQGSEQAESQIGNPVPAQEHVHGLPPEGELTAMGWNQEPQALTVMLTELAERFPGLPLFITENGSAWDDEVSEDEGKKVVHDTQRVAYLNAHVNAVADAIEAGAPVAGYFAWSLLDNFEWAWGYTKRFGIVRVDYDTQERIWKDSAVRYSEIVRANAI